MKPIVLAMIIIVTILLLVILVLLLVYLFLRPLMNRDGKISDNTVNKESDHTVNSRNIVDGPRVGMFVRVKDEYNIVEFCKYYYALGIDFILFQDDYSVTPVESVLITAKIPPSKYQIIIAHLDETGTFTDRFKNEILPLLKKHMEYCLYVDIDEYLFLGKRANVQSWVMSYKPFDQLKINWLLFGSNGLISTNDMPHSRLVTNFTASNTVLNKHVKSLVRLSAVDSTTNPHFFELLPGKKTINMLGNKSKAGPFEDLKEVGDVYIAHYHVQDALRFVQRKLMRKVNNMGTSSGVHAFANSSPLDVAVSLQKGTIIDDFNQHGLTGQFNGIFDMWTSHNCNDVPNFNLLESSAYRTIIW
jgi:hypothetical protein